MVLRVLRTFSTPDYPDPLTPKRLLDALLGRSPVPPGISDSRPLARNSRPPFITQLVHDSCAYICKRIVDPSAARRPKRRRIETESKNCDDDDEDVDKMIVKMCRMLNGMSLTRKRNHRLTLMEKKVIDCVRLGAILGRELYILVLSCCPIPDVECIRKMAIDRRR